MSFTMYEAVGARILPVQVVKCTSTYVWVKRKKFSFDANNIEVLTKFVRYGNHSSFHESWQEAKAHLLKEAEERLLQARHELQTAQAFHGNVKGLKPPTA